jgi:hypothetical protein
VRHDGDVTIGFLSTSFWDEPDGCSCSDSATLADARQYAASQQALSPYQKAGTEALDKLKGMETPTFRAKRRQVEALYPVQIETVS